MIIDPVLDLDLVGPRLWTASIDTLLARVDEQGLRLRAILDTHLHADHVTGAAELRRRTGAFVVMGAGFAEVRSALALRYGCPDAGPQPADRLMSDGEGLALGSLRVWAYATPGHTPSCTTWRLEDALFVGDTLFMPDFGTGRCDFPGGSARELFGSVRRLYGLPDELPLPDVDGRRYLRIPLDP